jgi:hypothetical protein
MEESVEVSILRFKEKEALIVSLASGMIMPGLLEIIIFDRDPVVFFQRIKYYIVLPAYQMHLLVFFSALLITLIALYGLFANITERRALVLSGVCFSAAFLLIIAIARRDWSLLHMYYASLIFMGALFRLHWSLLKPDGENGVSVGKT